MVTRLSGGSGCVSASNPQILPRYSVQWAFISSVSTSNASWVGLGLKQLGVLAYKKTWRLLNSCKTPALQDTCLSGAAHTKNLDFSDGLRNLTYIMDSMLQHTIWRHDGPYTWPVSEELKCQLRQILQAWTWPREYHEEPVRIDRLANLLKYVHRTQSVIDIHNNLRSIPNPGYVKRLKEDVCLRLEVVPAFYDTAVFRLRVKPHPIDKDFDIVDVDGTKFLVGGLADWVVFANGTGSTSLVVENGVTVLVQFNIKHLAMYGGLVQKLRTVGNATDCRPGPAAFLEPRD